MFVPIWRSATAPFRELLGGEVPARVQSPFAGPSITSAFEGNGFLAHLAKRNVQSAPVPIAAPKNYMDLIKLPPKKPIATPEPFGSLFTQNLLRVWFPKLEAKELTLPVVREFFKAFSVFNRIAPGRAIAKEEALELLEKMWVRQRAFKGTETQKEVKAAVIAVLGQKTDVFKEISEELYSMYKAKYGISEGTLTVPRALHPWEFVEIYNVAAGQSKPGGLLYLTVKVEPSLESGLKIKTEDGVDMDLSGQADSSALRSIVAHYSKPIRPHPDAAMKTVVLQQQQATINKYAPKSKKEAIELLQKSLNAVA